MKGKLIWSIFWASVAVFAIVLGMIFTPAGSRLLMPFVFLPSLAVFLGLGVTLIVLTVKAKVRGMLKKFFLLTGASAAGLPVFAVLHNLVYALLINFFDFGADFDEPFFFIMAVFICPLGFLVGAIGNIVLFAKKPWLVPKSPSRRR